MNFSNEYKEKFVNTFIDNLQNGRVQIDYSAMTDHDDEVFKKLKLGILNLVNQNTTSSDRVEKIGSIYNYILELRLDLVIKGELLDKTNEDIILELRGRIEVLEEKNQKLYSDNVILANQLHDTSNIITGYEQAFVPKKEDEK